MNKCCFQATIYGIVGYKVTQNLNIYYVKALLMTINKVVSASTRDFSEAVKWAAKTSDGLIRLDVAKDDTVLYMSSFHDTKSSRSKIDIDFVSGKKGDHTFVVSSTLLANSLKLIKGTEFTFSVSSSQMVIKTGRSVINLPVVKGVSAITLPELPPIVGRVSISDLRKAISHVSLAAATDDATVSLMSIHCAFSPSKKKATFVATDRYKMMVRNIDFDPIDDNAEDFSMNILASSMKTLIAGLPSTDSTIDIHASPSNSQLVIRDVNYMTGVGAIDGEFAKYEQFLSLPFAYKVKMELAELKGAIDGISALSTTEEGISLTFTPGNVVVSSVSGVGSTECSADGELPASDDENEEQVLKTAFSPKIIRPVLSSLTSKEIELHYNSSAKPWVVRELDEATGEVLSSFTLMMPIRLPNA